MKTIAQSWAFESSSSDTIYQTLRYTDGSTSCDCPGWTRRIAPNGTRSCKHTRLVEMGIADRQAISTKAASGQQPPPEPPPTKAKKKQKVEPERRFNFDE